MDSKGKIFNENFQSEFSSIDPIHIKRVEDAYKIFTTPYTDAFESAFTPIHDIKREKQKWEKVRADVDELLSTAGFLEKEDLLSDIDEAILMVITTNSSMKNSYKDCAKKSLLFAFSETKVKDILASFSKLIKKDPSLPE